MAPGSPEAPRGAEAETGLDGAEAARAAEMAPLAVTAAVAGAVADAASVDAIAIAEVGTGPEVLDCVADASVGTGTEVGSRASFGPPGTVLFSWFSFLTVLGASDVDMSIASASPVAVLTGVAAVAVAASDVLIGGRGARMLASDGPGTDFGRLGRPLGCATSTAGAAGLIASAPSGLAMDGSLAGS